MNRATISLAILGAVLVALPFLVGNYALSVATLILYFAYTGQAWNVMMGFAGQLSLGHALYVGVGGYAAGALFFHYGIGPWLGLWLAILACVLLGLVIGFLAFRFGISGVYFALLTIAFAEFTRIGFDHVDWTGGPGVFFAFYDNNLFPEQIFGINRSIELILGPVSGGVGTLFGPILGAAVLTLLSDGITEGLALAGWEIPGIKQVFYGLILLAV